MAISPDTFWYNRSAEGDEASKTAFSKAAMDAAIMHAYGVGSKPGNLIISNPYIVATFRALKRFGQPVNRANRHKYRRAWLYETQFMRVR